ncbi:MAG: hypothetical protein ABI666_06085 [Ferruginibacter sp.]
MKRKTFILTTTVAALAVVSIPVVRYYNKRSGSYNPLTMPNDLSRFCDEKTVREIGISYRNMVPAENEKKKLTELLLTDYDGKVIASSDKDKIFELLDKKTLTDFSDYNKLQVINGWIISITEARQCALFSLT